MQTKTETQAVRMLSHYKHTYMYTWTDRQTDRWVRNPASQMVTNPQYHRTLLKFNLILHAGNMDKLSTIHIMVPTKKTSVLRSPIPFNTAIHKKRHLVEPGPLPNGRSVGAASGVYYAHGSTFCGVVMPTWYGLTANNRLHWLVVFPHHCRSASWDCCLVDSTWWMWKYDDVEPDSDLYVWYVAHCHFMLCLLAQLDLTFVPIPSSRVSDCFKRPCLEERCTRPTVEETNDKGWGKQFQCKVTV